MTDTVDATVYLQVEPEWSSYAGARDTPGGVIRAKVVGSTQGRSRRPRPGTVEVKVTLRLPKAAFVALRPEAVVLIPETLTTPHPVEVIAEDPN